MKHVQPVLFRSKTNKFKEHPIYIRITVQRKSIYLNTKQYCTKELWDDTNYLVLEKHPLHQTINTIINTILTIVNEAGDNCSKAELKKKVKQKVKHSLVKAKKPNKTDVLAFIQDHRTKLLQLNKFNTAKTYRYTHHSLKAYMNGKQLQFKDITADFLDGFEHSFRIKGVGGNSISVAMRCLRRMFKLAIRRKLVSLELYPFIEYNISKLKVKTVKRAISKEDILKIIALKPGRYEVVAKNVFLFSYYCRGMNFIDIAYLKWSDVNGNRMTYTRRKTGINYNIELLPPALAIIESYRNNNSNYIFPILNNHKYIQPVSIDNRLTKCIRQVSYHLKSIAKKADIKAKLTTYVARHTWGTVLKKQGVSTSIISEAYGHTDEKTTQIYLDSFGSSVLDKANELIL